MKTIIKLSALALIAAFAVISCSPEAELSDVDWKKVNAEFNATKNTDATPPTSGSFTFSAVSGTDTPTLKINEFTLTAPENSDFLKSSSEKKVESELKKILSLHYFTVADPVYGEADTLDDPLSYTLVKRAGEVVTLKLDQAPDNTKRIIAKINGTKYTFAGGNKMDIAKRGKTGEAGYDDLYYSLTSYGTTFFAPGNKGWYLTLGTIPGGSGATDTPTTRQIATLVMDSNRVNDTIRREIGDKLLLDLGLESYATNRWAPAPLSSGHVTFTVTATGGNFTIENFVRTDLTPYRVVWNGKAPCTSDVYFGVKQWIKIYGANTGTTATTTQHDYYMKAVYGEVSAPWYLTDVSVTRYVASTPRIAIYSYDIYEKNVVIDVIFERIFYNTTYHGLVELTNQAPSFRDNFKIAYYRDTEGGVDDFFGKTDLAYINIKEYEYLTTSTQTPLYQSPDTIRITLDPSYKMDTSKAKYLYLSPEICYTSTSKSGYGSFANWQYNFFKAYGGYTSF